MIGAQKKGWTSKENIRQKHTLDTTLSLIHCRYPAYSTQRVKAGNYETGCSHYFVF